ncbi:hypothetical protein Ahy_B02g057318 [Arachis hypogaea]|uniref:Uncharacterized protein n=1 Tax=Arachis hypogaea TaxID=3818 RepID=A0A445ABJ4_ARAHY|nr:hypothetical protein Ahy_B02g057318 [Arachis hypogaea]
MNDFSSSSSIKSTTVEIQGTFKNSEETFKFLANNRRTQQETSKSSSKNTEKKEETLFKQTKDLKCSTRLLNEKFEKMSEAKKAIIRELGFGGLMHILPMNVPHKLLKELANSFNLVKNKLDTRHGDLFFKKLSFKELSEENKEIFRRF